ncbi:MAG: hypothetical protein RBT76_15460 [candidate division Zixibacteria bacterium]|jgi:hypothetical protein|nr:hypothetical protein [candidate division Zixibacteria bacterium]
MLRNILGVIVGYVVMAAFVFVSFSVVYMILGTEGSFSAGSYEVSGGWIVASVVLSLIAALIGGMVCTIISRNMKATMVLAGIVLILGMVMAVPTLSDTAAEASVRTGDVPMMEAMQKAKQPSWLAFLNPVIGAVGILLGGRKKRPSSTATSQPSARQV